MKTTILLLVLIFISFNGESQDTLTIDELNELVVDFDNRMHSDSMVITMDTSDVILLIKVYNTLSLGQIAELDERDVYLGFRKYFDYHWFQFIARKFHFGWRDGQSYSLKLGLYLGYGYYADYNNRFTVDLGNGEFVDP
ncbi:MAG: hypothetical protein QNK23_08595 [Crocinitomicaceae bacterium]|nr:hypothetical protein [Crocinitomicaceae bacterium]